MSVWFSRGTGGESTRRSVAYYREPEGKVKKQALNGQRRSREESFAHPWIRCRRRCGDPGVWCVLVGLIEGRRVSAGR